MTRVPSGPPVARTAEERSARARALRRALGPVSGWPEEARDDLAERAAIVEVSGGIARGEASRVAEEAVRASLLRRIP